MRPTRDRLVNDATFRGLFPGVTTTASAPVYPVFMELTGRYPQVVYSELEGRTRNGLTGGQGQITFDIQVQNVSGTSVHGQIQVIASRINELLDDQNLTGVSISGTAVYSYLMTRAGGTPTIYDPARKVFDKFVSYDYEVAYY